MAIKLVSDVLKQYVQTTNESSSEQLLARLLTDYAEPVVKKIVRYKTRGTRQNSVDQAETEAEDISSEVMLQLVQRLRKFRFDYLEKPIEDFNAYVAVTTYNAYDRYVSRKYPARRRLKNGLRYLLTHRADFALWQGADGIWRGGFNRWQTSSSHRNDAATAARLQMLREDARTFARENAASSKDWHDPQKGFELLSAIFAWTNAPVEIDTLTSIVAEWWNVSDEIVEIDASFASSDGSEQRETQASQIADNRPNASIETERRDYLKRLWLEIVELPPRQRSAVLLNLRDEGGRGIVDLWIILGVITAEQMAQALDLSLEDFAKLWRELPLKDNRIAAHLGLTRQQVINLRKSARERLARRLKGL